MKAAEADPSPAYAENAAGFGMTVDRDRGEAIIEDDQE
jgi:hypothetical protein